MLRLSLAPRLARMLVEAERRGCASEGAILAALASERDMRLERRALVRGETPWPDGPSDLLLELELFGSAERQRFEREACRALGVDSAAARAVDRARRQLAGGARGNAPDEGRRADPETLLRCVLAAFPDRVVRRRGAGSPRGVMVGGTGVVLDRGSVVRDAELFVAIDVDAGPRRKRSEALVRSASAVAREWLEEVFPGSIRDRRELAFDSATERVVERIRSTYRDLVLDETLSADVDPTAAGTLLAEAARGDPVRALAPGNAERAFLERVAFLARQMPELGLPEEPDRWLARIVEVLAVGRRSFAELHRADLLARLRDDLTRDQLRALDREAPERHRLPSGRMARIVYERGRMPVLAGKIQELFGLDATPRIAGGRAAVQIEILAPSGRPVQVTDDLASFWTRTYPEVRKELRGRYPRHAWPERPGESGATKGAERSGKARRRPR